jgi:phage terminase small subunit
MSETRSLILNIINNGIEMDDNKEELTDKQKIFIAEYCNNGFNATQAAIKAGYSEGTARQIASDNLSKAYIKQAIKDYLDEILSQYKNTLEYEIIQTYKIRAFYNTEDIIDHEGKLVVKELKELGELTRCIDGIETTINTQGIENRKVKLANRESALEKLSTYMGLLKQELVHSGSIQIIEIPQRKDD